MAKQFGSQTKQMASNDEQSSTSSLTQFWFMKKRTFGISLTISDYLINSRYRQIVLPITRKNHTQSSVHPTGHPVARADREG